MDSYHHQPLLPSHISMPDFMPGGMGMGMGGSMGQRRCIPASIQTAMLFSPTRISIIGCGVLHTNAGTPAKPKHASVQMQIGECAHAHTHHLGS